MNIIKEFLKLSYAFIWFLTLSAACLFPFTIDRWPHWAQVTYFVTFPFQLAALIMWSKRMEKTYAKFLV